MKTKRNYCMPSIQAIENDIIEEFALFDSWEDKYEYMIDMGKKLPPLAEEHKVEENIIKGCQSLVWLVAKEEDGRIQFFADSNAVIVKGLISLLIRILSNRTPQEIMEAELAFIREIGMEQHLAQTRSNGLRAMVQQMKRYAAAYQIKNT